MVHLRLSWATEYIEASLGCIASSRKFWTAVRQGLSPRLWLHLIKTVIKGVTVLVKSNT